MEKTPLIDQPHYIHEVVLLWNTHPQWLAQDIATRMHTKVTKVRAVLQKHIGESVLKERATARCQEKRLQKTQQLTPQILEMFKSPQLLGLEDMARKLRVRYTHVQQIIAAHFTQEEITYREGLSRSKAKETHFSLSPDLMEEIHKQAHYTPDGKGYLLMLKPFWVTGKVGSKHIYVHQVVMMENLQITCIPAGFVVHHVNGDRTDNRIGNLALLTNEAHLKQHQVTQTSSELTLWELKEFMMWKLKQTTVI